MIVTPQLLISDDDRDFRVTLQSVFEPRGFSTILASDGAEAVEIVKNENIDVVLIDMHMPRMTGLEAIRHIRALGTSIPCILLSAAIDDAIRSQAGDAFSILDKPVDFHQVCSAVDSALAINNESDQAD